MTGRSVSAKRCAGSPRTRASPAFARFAELLCAKESPYVDFLRAQAREMRAEQNRYLERAADRAYLAMHAPLVPLLAVLVLVSPTAFSTSLPKPSERKEEWSWESLTRSGSAS